MKQLPMYFPTLGKADTKQLRRYGSICAVIAEKIRRERPKDVSRAASGIYSVIRWEIGCCRPRSDPSRLVEDIWST